MKFVGIVMVTDLLELALAYVAIVGERGRALGGGCRQNGSRASGPPGTHPIVQEATVPSCGKITEHE